MFVITPNYGKWFFISMIAAIVVTGILVRELWLVPVYLKKILKELQRTSKINNFYRKQDS